MKAHHTHIYYCLILYCLLGLIYNEELFDIWDPYRVNEYTSNTYGNAYNYIISDPNNYLTEDERASLMTHLDTLYQKDIQTFLIIIKEVDIDYAYNRSGLDLFAYELSYYMKKSNSNIKEANSLYILYSINNQRSLMLPGEIVIEKLPENECNKIQTKRLSQIRDELYFVAFDSLLKDTIYYEDVCEDCNTFWVGIGILSIAGLISVIAISIKVFLCVRGRVLSKEEEEQFNKMNDLFTQYDINRDVIDDICFICLEKIEVYESSNDIKAMPSCKHRMHLKCFELMVTKEDDESCIVCIEKIDKEDNKETLIRKVFNIQSKFYPVFKEIMFYISKNTLKWKFTNKLQTAHELLEAEE